MGDKRPAERTLSVALRKAMASIIDAANHNDMAYVVTSYTTGAEINVNTAKALWCRGLVVWDNSHDDGTYLYPTDEGWKVTT